MNVEQDEVESLTKGFAIPTLPEHFIDEDIIEQGGVEYLKGYLKALTSG